MTRPWFRPKRFGYGATPSSPEGWIVTIVSALIEAALVIIFGKAITGGASATAAGAVVGFGVVLLATILIAHEKTDGDWLWRR